MNRWKKAPELKKDRLQFYAENFYQQPEKNMQIVSVREAEPCFLNCRFESSSHRYPNYIL